MTPQNQKVNRRDFLVKSILAGSGLALGAKTLWAAGSSDFNGKTTFNKSGNNSTIVR